MEFPKGLIVSSQALEGNPLRHAEHLAVMAEAAVLGGAVAIRANGVEDIAAIRRRVNVPIIGIDKRRDSGGRVVITPDFEGAKRVHEAGADIIALEVVDYPSDIREDRHRLIDRIHRELGCPVMADISTLEEAKQAAALGVEAISTTFAGYIPGALHPADELYTPDFDLLRQIVALHLPCKIVAEGRIWDKRDMAEAIRLGADAVVIGKAVTNPMAITKYFVSGLEEGMALRNTPPTTEAVNPQTTIISDAPTAAILKMLNREDAKSAAVVADCIPAVAALAEQGAAVIQNGGRILYCGAGTSGRLAVADAAECPPTYGLSPNQIRAVIAGGPGAIVNASEGCEDSREGGSRAFYEAGGRAGDLVIGISAAGRAPFVLAFMEEAKKIGCTVGAIVNNRDTAMAALADIAVEALTGAEAIKGSTRMKAGTAQKMILNMFSTAVCILTGCTYQNYMVNMQPTNQKLRRRAITMVAEITGMAESAAERALEENGWNIRKTLEG